MLSHGLSIPYIHPAAGMTRDKTRAEGLFSTPDPSCFYAPMFCLLSCCTDAFPCSGLRPSPHPFAHTRTWLRQIYLLHRQLPPVRYVLPTSLQICYYFSQLKNGSSSSYFTFLVILQFSTPLYIKTQKSWPCLASLVSVLPSFLTYSGKVSLPPPKLNKFGENHWRLMFSPHLLWPQSTWHSCWLLSWQVLHSSGCSLTALAISQCFSDPWTLRGMGLTPWASSVFCRCSWTSF